MNSSIKKSSSSLVRFMVLFTVQAAVLLAVVALTYRSLGRQSAELQTVGATLPKATVAAEVLHYTDVLRVIHLSLIGAGTNKQYVDQRLQRLHEVEELTEKSIVAMEALPWSPKEREEVRSIAAGMRQYAASFAPILEKARRATPAELPALIQANTEYRRDAYNLLLEMLPRLRGEAEALMAHSGKQFERTQTYTLVGLGATILLTLSIFRLFFVHNRQTRRQAEELNRAMRAVSDGDLSRKCEVISKDELGHVAENLNEIFELLARNIRTVVEISGKLRSVADTVGSRSETVMHSAEGQGSAIGNAYTSIDTLTTGIRTISVNVEALAAASEQTSSSTLELVSSMEEVSRQTDTLSTSVDETASAATEMVSSINEVDQNVDYLKTFVTDTSASMLEMTASISEVEKTTVRSHELARHVCDAAESGMRAVHQTMKGMDEIRRSVHDANDVVARLGERSTEIGRIVTVIDDVASQTNLLALNAAILAAQAREHGMGFTVVANEIRDLSERTAQSTREISSLVQSVQGEVNKALSSMGSGAQSVDRGVELATEAGRVLQTILDTAQKSLAMGTDIATAMKEQAKSSSAVAKAVERVQDMVRQINSATNQQAAGSNHILKAVEQMREVARSVRQATVEQKTGSVMISDAAEQMIEMVRQISGVTTTQTAESEKIVKTMEHVREIANGNKGSAADMNSSVGLLSDAIRELDAEVRKFKIKDEPAKEWPSHGPELTDRKHAAAHAALSLARSPIR